MQPFSEIYHQKSSSQHDRQSQRGLPSKSAGCIGSIEITSRPSNDPVDRNANPPVTATARIAVTAAIIPRHDRRYAGRRHIRRGHRIRRTGRCIEAHCRRQPRKRARSVRAVRRFHRDNRRGSRDRRCANRSRRRDIVRVKRHPVRPVSVSHLSPPPYFILFYFKRRRGHTRSLSMNTICTLPRYRSRYRSSYRTSWYTLSPCNSSRCPPWSNPHWDSSPVSR